MYKLYPNDPISNTPPPCVFRIADFACIPFDPANTDYQTFKRDLTEGVELQDAEGNVMTAKAVKDFFKTLP